MKIPQVFRNIWPGRYSTRLRFISNFARRLPQARIKNFLVEYSAVNHRRGSLEILAAEAAVFVFIARQKIGKYRRFFQRKPTGCLCN